MTPLNSFGNNHSYVFREFGHVLLKAGDMSCDIISNRTSVNIIDVSRDGTNQ